MGNCCVNNLRIHVCLVQKIFIGIPWKMVCIIRYAYFQLKITTIFITNLHTFIIQNWRTVSFYHARNVLQYYFRLTEDLNKKNNRYISFKQKICHSCLTIWYSHIKLAQFSLHLIFWYLIGSALTKHPVGQ